MVLSRELLARVSSALFAPLVCIGPSMQNAISVFHGMHVMEAVHGDAALVVMVDECLTKRECDVDECARILMDYEGLSHNTQGHTRLIVAGGFDQLFHVTDPDYRHLETVEAFRQGNAYSAALMFQIIKKHRGRHRPPYPTEINITEFVNKMINRPLPGYLRSGTSLRGKFDSCLKLLFATPHETLVFKEMLEALGGAPYTLVVRQIWILLPWMYENIIDRSCWSVGNLDTLWLNMYQFAYYLPKIRLPADVTTLLATIAIGRTVHKTLPFETAHAMHPLRLFLNEPKKIKGLGFLEFLTKMLKLCTVFETEASLPFTFNEPSGALMETVCHVLNTAKYNITHTEYIYKFWIGDEESKKHACEECHMMMIQFLIARIHCAHDGRCPPCPRADDNKIL